MGLICDAFKLLHIDGRCIDAARRAERRAAVARLMSSRKGSHGQQPGDKAGAISSSVSRCEAAAAGHDEAEKRHAAAASAQDRWEAANCGGYIRVFPSMDTDPQQQVAYERLLALAQTACSSRAHNCSSGGVNSCKSPAVAQAPKNIAGGRQPTSRLG